MNPFSQQLSSFVAMKNVSIAQMASFCGVDRSSMSKIVHGTRKPSSDELVQQIANFLKLTPEESSLLMEKYQIMQVGLENYRRRKGIHAFLQTCLESDNPVPHSAFKTSFYSLPSLQDSGTDSVILHGTGTIFSAYGYIAQLEMQRENGLLRVRIQPEERFIDFTQALRTSTDIADGFRFQQIIALDEGSALEDNVTFNLRLIHTMVRICKHISNYDIFYYHANVHTGKVTFSFLPYAIISRDYAMQISEDLRFAIVHRKPETVSFFMEIFANLRSACLPMTQSVRDYRDLLYNAKRKLSGHSAISFQMYPCVNCLLTEDLLQDYISEELPNRSFIIRASLEIIERKNEYLDSSSVSTLVSEKGLLRFLENGKMPEYSSALYRLPDPAVRIRLLRKYRDLIRQKSLTFHIVKEAFGNTASETSFWIDDSCAYILLADNPEKRNYLYIRDPEILSSLRDFFSHLPNHLAYSEEESMEILCRILDEHSSAP
ncbi:MAG: helix-turn-helix transcriptional regulator [Eubacteriales bacterium]|nr:helix-turn-helix transcriptional regulator [Eubacteriales bacterium]